MRILANMQNIVYSFRTFADVLKTIHGLQVKNIYLTEVYEASILFPFVSPGIVQRVAYSRCLTNAE